MPAISLRPYQGETLVALRDARDTTNAAGTTIRRALVVLATGLGKTVIMASIPKALSLAAGETMLVLAHREELIEQTVEKFHSVDPSLRIGVEKADRRAHPDCDVVVGSVQTLRGSRLDDFVRRFARQMAIIAIDEAHHAVAPGYQDILSAFPSTFIVGVTATPRRGDSIGLGEAFDRIVIHRDLKWGIDHGYLVPLRSYVARSEVDLSDIMARSKKNGGDFSDAEISRRVNQEARNHLIVKTYMQHVPTKKGLVFCASVEHARAVQAQFAQIGIKSAYAWAGTPRPERRWIVEEFRAGRIQVLVNCGLFTEGFDDPSVEVVVNGRPTKSPALYAQIVGRALRPLDSIASHISRAHSADERCSLISKSAKTSAIVIDILDAGKLPPGLQTLPTLWGLPANFDMRGVDVRVAVAKYEAVAARDHEVASAALTIEDFNVALEQFDAFAPPIPDPIAIESSKHNWLSIPGDAHRLSLPTAYVPVGVSAEELTQVRRELGRRIRQAQSNGEPDPVKAVSQDIGKEIATIKEWVEVNPTHLDRWVAVVHQRIYRADTSNPSERSRILADARERIDAFHAADAWLMSNRRDFLSLTDRSAPWRAEPISAGQKTLLTRAFHVPVKRLPTTSGEASDLINRLQNDKSAAAGPKQTLRPRRARAVA